MGQALAGAVGVTERTALPHLRHALAARDHLTAPYQALGLPEGPQARRPDAGRTGTPQTARGSRTGTLRRAGNRSIAAGLREGSYAPRTRPLDLLRLP